MRRTRALTVMCPPANANLLYDLLLDLVLNFSFMEPEQSFVRSKLHLLASSGHEKKYYAIFFTLSS
jgi:hypothetical protein